MEARSGNVFGEPTRYDSVFWVEVDRIQPNPFQPRREFDEERLKSLAESIRQYGVLQPLVVTRQDVELPGGGLQSSYELIAGERRLRASKLIGLRTVPVVIRSGAQTDTMKLELAIIENLQREDLNAIDRAKALAQLARDFGLAHAEIAAKIGRSREFVGNSLRLLSLPEEIQQSVVNKELTEGHARALLMLNDKPQEQKTLFKDIILKKTSVRVVEQMVRSIAHSKMRKRDKSMEMIELEKSLTETLGTRVVIENHDGGGRVMIEFFSPEDLSHIVATIAQEVGLEAEIIESIPSEAPTSSDVLVPTEVTEPAEPVETTQPQPPNTTLLEPMPEKPASVQQTHPHDEELSSVTNFTV